MPFALDGPTTVEVKQGESATATYRVLGTSKPFRPVSISVQGVPANVTALLSPSRAKPSFDSVLRLDAAVSAQEGRYPIMVTALDAKGAKTVSTSLFVVRKSQTIPPPGEPPFTADVWVAKTGSDSNDGSEGSPKLTITGASGGLSILNAGERMAIKAGTYAEKIDTNSTAIPNGSIGDPTEIVAYPGHAVVISATGPLNLATGGPGPSEISYIEWDGIEFINISGNNDVVSIFGNTHNVRFLNCKMHGANGALSGVNFQGPSGAGNFPINNALINCEIYENGNGGGGSGLVGHGIYASCGSLLLDNCSVHHNGDRGIQIFSSNLSNSELSNCILRNSQFFENGADGSAGGVGVTVFGDDHLVYNNLIFDNDQGVGVASSANNCAVYNNTVVNNTGTGLENLDTSTVVTNNICFGNGTELDNSGTGENNTTTNPNFVDGTGPDYDFHLQSGSNSRNTGSDLSGIFTTDRDGTSRPQGSQWDRGAYEQD